MKPNMQKMRSYLVLALMVFFGGLSGQVSAQRASVSFQTFYNELQPYGSWFNHPDYGYVWAPTVDSDFTPYATNGYWAVTEYGNTWVSNYDWGWAPFHYGRWYLDNFYGWIWVPDTVWSPAWVVWRNGGGYYGWAPMSPGLHFSFSFNLFNRIPYSYWTFCSAQYVWSPSWYGYSAPRSRNVYIVNNTTYVNNYYVDNSNHYYSGPSHRDYQRATGHEVRVTHVEECDRPGQYRIDRDKITVYRPSVSHHNNDRPTVEHNPRGNGNYAGWDPSHHGNNGGGGNGNGGGNGGGNGSGGGGNGNPGGGNDNPGGGNGNGGAGNGNPGGGNGNDNGGNGNPGGGNGNGGAGNGNPGGGNGNGNGGNGNPGGGNGNGGAGNGNPGGGNGNGGGGNNGHGNGDQDAPGNSGGHNNGENSETSGDGNSGNGNGGNDGSGSGNGGGQGGGNAGSGGNSNGGGNGGHGNSGRMQGSYSRDFQSERGNVDLPSRHGGTANWPGRGDQSFGQNPANNRNIQRSQPTMTERRGNSGSQPPMSFPGRSGGSRGNYGMSTPSRSNGNSGFSMPSHSGGSSRTSAPSGFGGSRGGGMKMPSSGGSRGSGQRRR